MASKVQGGRADPLPNMGPRPETHFLRMLHNFSGKEPRVPEPTHFCEANLQRASSSRSRKALQRLLIFNDTSLASRTIESTES